MMDPFRAFEQIKVGTEKSLKGTAEDANRQMTSVVGEAKGTCNELKAKSPEKDLKKEVESVTKKYSDRLDTIEKDSIKQLNDTWSTNKSKLQDMLESSRGALGMLGTFAKLEKTFREIIKFIEKILAQCVKMIQGSSSTSHKQLNDVGQNELVLEKSKFKAIADEMDQTVADLVGY